MKRTISREVYLPAFACDLASLSSLVSGMLEPFSGGEPTVNIHFTIGKEELSFETFEELFEYRDKLPSSVTELVIRISDWSTSHRWARISSRHHDQVRIYVEGESTSWCAAATEVAQDFAQRHKRWYASLRPWMVFTAGTLLWIIPSLYEKVNANAPSRSPQFVITWIATLLVIGSVYFRFQSIFRPFVLKVRSEERILQRFATEITVIAALVSAAAALLALLSK